MKNIGIDIISNKRIKKLAKKKSNFINKVLHKNEIMLLNNKKNKKEYYNFLSGRWAIKESIFKCVNNSYAFNKLEITYDKQNKPYVLFHETETTVKRLNLIISISHENNFTVAVAISI